MMSPVYGLKINAKVKTYRTGCKRVLTTFKTDSRHTNFQTHFRSHRTIHAE